MLTAKASGETMSKIALPTDFDVTKDSIQDTINQIEALLEGRIDKDNVFFANNLYARVDNKLVQDVASSVRPIRGEKVFGYHDEGSKFSNVFNKLSDAVKKRPRFITVSHHKQFSFISSDTQYNDILPELRIDIPFATNIRPVLLSRLDACGFDVSGFNAISYSSSDLVVRTNFSYSMDLEIIDSDTIFRDDFRIRFTGYTFQDNTLTLLYKLDLKKLGLDTNNFLEIYLEPTVLCEELL